jgi:hypothetical protein
MSGKDLAVTHLEEESFLVGSFLNNPFFFHDKNLEGVSYHREPLSDDQNGSFFHKVFYCLLDHYF